MATLALTHAATGDDAGARTLLAHFEEAGDHFAAGLLHAALGQREDAFAAFQKIDAWTYWPIFSVRYFYPDVWRPLRDDARFQALLDAADRSWQAG
jgi:hypothetical protein